MQILLSKADTHGENDMAWKFGLSLPLAVQASALMKNMSDGGTCDNGVDKEGRNQKDVFEPHGDRLRSDLKGERRVKKKEGPKE